MFKNLKIKPKLTKKKNYTINVRKNNILKQNLNNKYYYYDYYYIIICVCLHVAYTSKTYSK